MVDLFDITIIAKIISSIDLDYLVKQTIETRGGQALMTAMTANQYTKYRTLNCIVPGSPTLFIC